MTGSNIRAFYISASGVTIKNLTIINANYDGDGGAIYFSNSATSGTVTNCNFADNSASVVVLFLVCIGILLQILVFLKEILVKM